ncbi:hypothetical protein [Nocardioides speluncae]|uniref:hypothetical protein n=1 Tax=Nocardioides speluncae TaxID=2670337 RepID=UPI0012B182FF|nr:hypothetical protein [Nocardioides speluncae]
MTTSRRVMAGLATLATAMLMTGCSSFADKSADEIKDATIEDMKDVSAFTMAGTIDQDGGESELKFSMDEDGDCVGTLKRSGGTADFIVVKGEKSFFKADEALLTSTGQTDPAQVALMADKWIEQPVEQTDNFCNLDKFLEEFEDVDEDREVTKGDTTEVDGEDAIELISKDEKETTIVSIATDGDHHVLKMEGKGGDEPGSFTFTDYNENVEAEEPDDVMQPPAG